ncbi:MAG: hypothetical protein NTZ03_14950 [Actinobacteria bacterium]|nr:hypothetical protein [Actinomycetota bacterium]
MTLPDEPPHLDRFETLGDDSPTVSQRAATWATTHPALTALIAVAVVLASAALAVQWWQSRPVPHVPSVLDSVSIGIQGTGMGGVVTQRKRLGENAATSAATVVLEIKITLTAPSGTVGQVSGIVGPGIASSNAHNIPPILANSSSVGIVTSTLECPSAANDPHSARLSLLITSDSSPTPLPLEVPLGDVSSGWSTLVGSACSPLTPDSTPSS